MPAEICFMFEATDSQADVSLLTVTAPKRQMLDRDTKWELHEQKGNMKCVNGESAGLMRMVLGPAGLDTA